jgi:hypothetical protein
MLHGDGIICGTSTTGTGTLTLAATPVPPGGIDFDAWARATGFANSASFLVEYTLNEYTDSTFVTEAKKESGVGTLTLGGSNGITNCTLARTKIEYTITSLNSQPAVYTHSPGSGISIGTAANTLISVSPRSGSILALTPYFDNTEALGGSPLMAAATLASVAIANNTTYWTPFVWPRYMAVKRASLRVQVLYTGGTTNINMAVYLPGTSGRPVKLLVDFGVIGTAGSSLVATGNIQSAALGMAVPMRPGIYIVGVKTAFSGGSGSPQLRGGAGMINPCLFGTSSLAPIMSATTSAGTPGDDPANLTGWTGNTITVPIFFALAES